MPVIVTGAAGFIGMHVCEALLARGEAVVGVDVFNDYYDPALKDARAARLAAREGFRMVRMDVAEAET
ncbi:MAG TPA: NAD-dependent epimerase/dehydratase family protein, partial [Phenylobacterium sp.]